MAKEKFKKAYIVIPDWCDEQDPKDWKMQASRHAIYAETASKARYQQYLNIEGDSVEAMMAYRALRWKEKDLFPPVLHDSLECLNESQIKKMKHTYGVESREPGNRNYYNCPWDDEDFKTLLALDMAIRNPRRDENLTEGSTYFHLTDFGIEVIMSTRERLREDINGSKQ